MHSSILQSALRFRRATSLDIARVVGLVESAYRRDLLDFFGEGQRTEPETIAELITRSNSQIILAECNDHLVSSCHLVRMGDIGCFSMFAVHPKLQGQGFGAAMLTEAERVVRKEWGCGQMRLAVICARKRLIAWYERSGYGRNGEHELLMKPRIGYSDIEEAIVMEVLTKVLVEEGATCAGAANDRQRS